MNDNISLSDTGFIVTRNLKLEVSMTGDEARETEQSLEAVEGISRCRLVHRRRSIRITYDVRRFVFEDIEQRIDEMGYRRSRTVWSRMRNAWLRYLDSNARANASGGSGACCSSPGEVYAIRRRR